MSFDYVQAYRLMYQIRRTEEEIIEYCRQRLASYKKPESVVFIQELPYNTMGKVLKRVLREQYNQPIQATT